jgi:hypothetical protein
MAGTGKTTIAYSLCAFLNSTRELAACFFCSSQLQACRNVHLILPTISYQLALFSRPFRYALSRVLEKDPDVHTRQLSDQFKGLILDPLQEAKRTMPTNLVVVIDALDECDDVDGVDSVLGTLISQAPDLPLKFLVTSRPDARILERMRSREREHGPLELRLHALELSIVQEDIRTYLKFKLEHMKLSDEDLENLVAQSGVLFIYAATVVRYIKGLNSPRRLNQALDTSTSSTSKKDKAIDSLYTTILEAALDHPDLEDLEREEMKLVLDTVVCAQEQLTVAVIAGLLRLVSETSARAVLSALLSVLNLSEETGQVTVLHESFRDFMLNEKRAGRFYCNSKERNGLLSQQCFDLISVPNPPFNICGLESSYLFDEDVPGLNDRVEKCISNELFYACRYWGSHLELADSREELFHALRQFLSERLLLWMEVMNLKRCINDGAKLLSRVAAWSQVGH